MKRGTRIREIVKEKREYIMGKRKLTGKIFTKGAKITAEKGRDE
jgi:hypothetical protein